MHWKKRSQEEDGVKQNRRNVRKQEAKLAGRQANKQTKIRNKQAKTIKNKQQKQQQNV